jgi:hypothetical protein
MALTPEELAQYNQDMRDQGTGRPNARNRMLEEKVRQTGERSRAGLGAMRGLDTPPAWRQFFHVGNMRAARDSEYYGKATNGANYASLGLQNAVKRRNGA